MYLETIILVHTVLFSRIIAFPNLALNGSAIQSSVYNWYGPSRVIDGNRNQAFYGESCCHTAVGEKSAWWRLDLGYSAYIHRIVIYYRKNRPDRLKGYHLYISNSFKENNPNSGHECSHYPMSMNNPTIIQNKTCDWTGRYIVYYNKREDFNAFVELCEVEVFGCYVGRYGSQCKSRCSVNCNNGTCSIWDGSCASCKEGFKGDRCDQVCDKGTYGINCSTSCTNCKNQSCDHRTGECPTEAGCKAGFHGSKCSKSCSANTYSENCQLQCHCLDGVTCDNVNGQCPDGLCDPGWRSNTCSQKCEVGTYGPNCQNTCDKCKYTECNQFNGTCTHGCSAGWKGPKCEISCETGTYGPNCQDTCDNCKDTECNQFNGTCTDGCSAGWKGSKCDMRCKNGTYGPNCQDTCDNCQETECNQFNGTCTRGCSAGWKGPKCEIPCYYGTYGTNCQETCDNCKDTECNQFNGTCTHGCSAGWMGPKCAISCSADTYGENCRYECHCFHGKPCDNRNGRCPDGLCGAGWQSNSCNQTCGKGTYGINCSESCRNCINESCDHFNGRCLTEGGCKAGYQGLKCSEGCSDSTYGENCRLQCHCLDGNTCNKLNGQCPNGLCDPGWKLNTCSHKCDTGFYGVNCSFSCSNCITESCDHFKGICKTVGSCKAGYRGIKCNQWFQDKERFIYIGSSCLLVMVVITLITYICYKKSRKKPALDNAKSKDGDEESRQRKSVVHLIKDQTNTEKNEYDEIDDSLLCDLKLSTNEENNLDFVKDDDNSTSVNEYVNEGYLNTYQPIISTEVNVHLYDSTNDYSTIADENQRISEYLHPYQTLAMNSIESKNEYTELRKKENTQTMENEITKA